MGGSLFELMIPVYLLYALTQAQDELWTSFFGGLLSWALFTCVLIQCGYYFTHFRRDHAVVRGTVLLLLVIEVGSTAFLTWTAYVTQVTMWGHEPSFAPQTWGNMLFDCTTASVVHAMYIWRIRKLTERRSLARSSTILIALLSTSQFACCFAASLYNALQDIQGPDKQFVARRLFHTWLACASSADVLITLVIASVLYCSRTGVHATDTLIKRVLLVTIPGGAITAIIQLGILVVQLVATDTTKTTFLILILTKFYSNSVLLCFNLRVKFSNPLIERSSAFNGEEKRYSYAHAPQIRTLTTQGHSDDTFRDLSHDAHPWLGSSSVTSSSAAPAPTVFDRHRPTTLEGFLEAQPHSSLFMAAGGTLTDKFVCASATPGKAMIGGPSCGCAPDETMTSTILSTPQKARAKSESSDCDEVARKRPLDGMSFTHDTSYASTSSSSASDKAIEMRRTFCTLFKA